MNQVRVQILLDRRQHVSLKNAARRAKVSLSELMREMADQYLAQNALGQDDEVLQALENLRHVRERQAVYRGDPISEARTAREDPFEQG